MKSVLKFSTLLILSLSLTSCNPAKDIEKDMDKAVNSVLNKPLNFKPGTYKGAFSCVDETKTKNIPQITMLYKFEADGTYEELATVMDPSCTANCKVQIKGTYKATASKFTLNQKFYTEDKGQTVKTANEVATFDVLGYLPAEGQLVLTLDSEDNACKSKMLFVLIETPNPMFSAGENQ